MYYWQGRFDGRRKTLLLVHGFRGDHNGLRFIAEGLEEKFNVIVPDLPGFGKSSEFESGKHDLNAYVDALREFIEELKLKQKPLMVAHSFGTIVTSKLAYEAPDVMGEKVVLICPIATKALTGRIVKLGDRIVGLTGKMPDKLGKKMTGSKLVADLVSLKMTKTKDKELKRRVKEEHRRYFGGFATNKSMIEGMRAANSGSVGMFAREIDKEILVIATELDDLTSVESQKRLVKKFTNARIEVVDETGHLVHYERPEEVARLVKEFM